MVFILLLILYYWQQIVNILAEKIETQHNVQTIKKQMESDLDDSNPPLVSNKPSKMYSILNKTTENIAWFLEQPELFFKNIQIKSFEIMEKTLGLSSQNI
jgi:hypothetical protein